MICQRYLIIFYLDTTFHKKAAMFFKTILSGLIKNKQIQQKKLCKNDKLQVETNLDCLY